MYFSFDVQLLEITTQSSTVIAWLQLAVSCVYFICKYQKKKKKNNGRHLLQIVFYWKFTQHWGTRITFHWILYSYSLLAEVVMIYQLLINTTYWYFTHNRKILTIINTFTCHQWPIGISVFFEDSVLGKKFL